MEGANDDGGYSLPGARVSDRKIFKFSFIDANTPKIQNSTIVEDVITVNDQVQQLNDNDPRVLLFVPLIR